MPFAVQSGCPLCANSGHYTVYAELDPAVRALLAAAQGIFAIRHVGPAEDAGLRGVDGQAQPLSRSICRTLHGDARQASWLAWQLGAPTVHLDLYLAALEPIVQWRTDDLARAVSNRLDKHRPVIVEGVLALDALDLIKRKADFVVFVKGVGGHKMASQIAAYCSRRNLPQSAQFTMDGYVE